MKILITGSSGILGTELCEVLGSEYEIAGIDIVRPRDINFRPQTFYEVSITDEGEIQPIFEKERPDLVIHAAAWTDVDGCEEEPEKAYEINTGGTERVTQAARGQEIPVIFISTDFVFDGKKETPYTEAETGRPLGVYGKTKWDAEEILKKNLTHYVIVRTSWLFGKAGKNFVDTIIARSKTEKRLRVVSDQIGSPTYAKDLAHALRKLLMAIGISGQDLFHISNSGQCSWYDFAKKILALTDKGDVLVEPITSAELARPAPRPRFSVLDCSKFERTTEHSMRPWQEAVADYIRERYGVVIQDA